MTTGINLDVLSLPAADKAVRNAWENQSASPFLGQIRFDAKMTTGIGVAIRRNILGSVHNCHNVFADAPYAAVWTTLHALSKRYGAATKDVYLHIGDELGLVLGLQSDREMFKTAYRRACRKIGLKLQESTMPTGLFFSNLGVADAQTDKLAECLLNGAVKLGPPPEEDLTELRAWQSAVTREGLKTYTRAQAALRQDTIASYSQLFCDWRAGEAATNLVNTYLFEALEAAAARLHVDAAALVSPPRLLWTEHGLALMASASSRRQVVEYQRVPSIVTPGQPWSVPVPWPDSLRWKCGHLLHDVRITPKADEILIFALDTQRLVTRITTHTERIAVPSAAILVLGGAAFVLHGPACATPSIPQGQAHLSLVEVPVEGVCIKTGASTVLLDREQDPAMRISSPIIGRCGSLPLYGSAAVLAVVAGKDFANEGRVLRVRSAGTVWYVEDVAFDTRGEAEVPLAELGFGRAGDPVDAQIELLVTGAAPGPEARAEFSGRFFIWPGTESFNPDVPFRVNRIPANLLANTTEHIGQDEGGLWIDPGAAFRHATLSLEIAGRQRDFAIPVRGTTLFRNTLADGQQHPVRLGSILILSHAGRQDTISVRSTDRNVDLWVRGTVIRRPFIARSEWEIPASQINPDSPVDDQIALLLDDGSRRLLCRISNPIEPHNFTVEASEAEVRARTQLPYHCDAIGVEIYREHGKDDSETALVQLGSRPISAHTPAWLRAEILEVAPQVVELIVDRRCWRINPGLGLIVMRPAEGDEIVALKDAHGRPFMLPLIAASTTPTTRDPVLAARDLASMLAGSYQPVCDSVVREVLLPRASGVISTRAVRGLHSLLLRLVFTPPVVRQPGFLSRLDMLHPNFAPELFSGDPRSFSALGGIAAARRLAAMAETPVMKIPDMIRTAPTEDGLLSEWLEDLEGAGTDVPDALSADALRQAFQSFRQNAIGSDFYVAMAHETIGQTLTKTLHVYAPHLKELLAYDNAAGTDRTGVHLAAYLSRFARACRAGTALEFHRAVSHRTSLPVEHVTPATSFALHVGWELFAYFMIFWELVSRERRG